MKSALVFFVIAAVFVYVNAMPADGDTTPAPAVTPAPGAAAADATPAPGATPAPAGDAPTTEPPTTDKPPSNFVEATIQLFQKTVGGFLNSFLPQ